MKKPIRVLVVDDSALVRQTMETIISQDPELELMGSASDPFIAAKKLRSERPDVITLDVEMPRMDGITFLEKIMSQHPIPVVMCSTLVGTGSRSALRALELGAVEIIEKPKTGTRQFFEESQVRITDAIKAAAYSNIGNRSAPPPLTSSNSLTNPQTNKVLTADTMLKRSSNHSMMDTTEKVVAIGASTGGTEALKLVLEQLPIDSPGILIVQHMPEQFTAAFADRLNSTCQVEVKEAVDGTSVLRGHVLIAPGNSHMMLQRSGARYYVTVKDGPLVSRHRPSVDVLFRSMAAFAGRNALGILMTGMGSDGAQGLKEMNEAGAKTFAQDEKTSVVYGMPAAAVKMGAVERSLPLHQIAPTILQYC